MKHAFIVWSLILALALALVVGMPLAGARRPPEHPINVNTATVTELMQLPRVGAKTGERIVAFREAHGPFQRLEEIMSIKGIGPKAFQRLQPYLKLDDREP